MSYYMAPSQSFPTNVERSEPYLDPQFYSAPAEHQQNGPVNARNYFPNARQWPILGAAGSGALQPRVQRIVGWSDSTPHGINPAGSSSRMRSHYAPNYPLISSNGFALQHLTQAHDFTNSVQTQPPINHLPNPNVPQNEVQFDMNMDVMFDANAIRTPLPLMSGPVTINSPTGPPILPFGDPLHSQVQFPAINFNISDAINIGVPLEPQLMMAVESFALDDGPQIHERFNKSRAVQTSGDPSIGKSLLFESEVPNKRLGIPYTEGHWGTGFVQHQPIIRIDETEEELPINELEREAIASAEQLAQREATFLDQGIKQFCEQSFPNNPQLQEKLRKMMPFEVTRLKKEKLAEFLQEIFGVVTEEGREKRWKCLFSGPYGPCTAVIKRRDGAIGHILEKHLHVMPIECGGECGEPKCTLRFSTAAMKSNHTRTNTQITCNLCGRSTSARNICRHQKTSICRQVAARLVRPVDHST
ncbi:hypothetical protein FRB91_000933 [Serendipita sp. 411]|nr:hypothetical protein FRB91_000933 [Serendipita sp. 411]